MAVRYRNKQTGSVSTYPAPRPNLEQSDRWDRVDDDDRPATSDPKDVWISYATSRGVDVDGMTKDDIIDAVS